MPELLTNVVYVPSQFRIWDFINADGLTHYGKRTLEDIRAEYPDAVVMNWQEAHRLHCEHFRTPISEITKAQYWYALEVLPPCKWRGVGDSFECFHVSEAITANVVNWYLQTRSESGERFYTLADYSSLKPGELCDRLIEFRNANPQSAPVLSWVDAEGANV